MKLIDLTGQKFGKLTVISRATDKKYNNPHWICSCSCGNIDNIIVSGNNLRQGRVKSCGCLRRELTVVHNKNMDDSIRCKKRKTNIYDLTNEYGIGHLDDDEIFLFDLEDYEIISKYYWVIKYGNNGKYKRVVTCCKLNGKKYKNLSMHQLLTGKKNIDHINRNPLDNRKCNFREATYQENSQNRSKQSNNTSGIIGVLFRNDTSKWVARINIDKKQTTIYYGGSFEEAVKSRLQAEKKYYGEFAPQKHLYEEYGII